MCSCEPSFTCPRCTGTPFDPAYFDEDDPREITLAAFDRLVSEQHRPVLSWGEE